MLRRTSLHTEGARDGHDPRIVRRGLPQVLYGPLYTLLHAFSIRALVRQALGRDTGIQEVSQNA